MPLYFHLSAEVSTKGLPSRRALRRFLEPVLRTQLRDYAKTGYAVGVCFVSPRRIQRLNATYRHRDKPTNILSFPYEGPNLSKRLYLGDLVICPAVVKQEAKAEGKLLFHHFAHLMLHGGLHLLGFDHETAREAAQMEALEDRLFFTLFHTRIIR